MILNAIRRGHVPRRRYVLATFLALLVLGASPSWSQTCSGNSPAFVVDEDLWLTNFFRPGLTDLPGNRIPPERDSTDWGSLTIPGANSGHELFWAVDVLGDHLFVAYNAGLQVWNIRETGGELPRAENPNRITLKDGWRGEFLSFPEPGEDDFFVEDIDVIEGPGSTVYVAISGRFPVGMSVWKFDTNNETLTTLYQNSNRSSRQVRLVDASATNNGSQIYAISSRENAVEVFDITRADQIDPCNDDQSTSNVECPGVYRGNVDSSSANLTAGGYLDVMKLPSGEVYIGVSDGTTAASLGLDLWQVNLQTPQDSIRRFSGLDTRTFGLAFFSQPSGLEGGGTNYYLGAIERDGSSNWIRIFDVSNCLTSNCSTLPRVGQQIDRPASLARQFLTYSTSNGTPFLYYGLVSPSIIGPKLELLLDVSNINNLKEITTGGPTYLDICSDQEIGYWGWYYSRNEFGFDNFTPTIGKFHPTRNYFYRAAVGMWDVHVWQGGATVPVMNVALDPDQGDLWFDEPIGFSASALNCPGAETWTWSDDDTFASTIDDNGTEADFTFATCGSSNECPTRDIQVSAVKDACAGDPNLIINSVQVSVSDPRAFIDGIDVAPPGNAFPVCSVLTFDTDPNPPRGRAPFGYDWSVRTVAGIEILSGNGPSLTWDTSLLDPDPEIFADGFELGNVLAWTNAVGLPFGGDLGTKAARPEPAPSVRDLVNKTGGALFTVEVGVSNLGGPVTDTQSIQVTINPLGPLGFDPNPITAVDQGGGAFDLQANSQSATEWKWEIEDPENGSSIGCEVYASCVIFDWDPGNQVVSYQWQTPNVPGDYGVTVWIRNCEQFDDPLSADTTVMVENLEIPEITGFRVPNSEIQPVNPTGPCKFFDVIDQVLHCLVNEEIEFEVSADGNPSAYEFAWETGNDWGAAVPATPTVLRTFSTTGSKPSRVRATTNQDEPFAVQQTLVIVNSLP